MEVYAPAMREHEDIELLDTALNTAALLICAVLALSIVSSLTKATIPHRRWTLVSTVSNLGYRCEQC